MTADKTEKFSHPIESVELKELIQKYSGIFPIESGEGFSEKHSL